MVSDNNTLEKALHVTKSLIHNEEGMSDDIQFEIRLKTGIFKQ